MSATSYVIEGVKSVLLDALQVDVERIIPEATLQADVGAESIDLMDIAFRLERHFGIRILRDELFPESIFRGDTDFVRDNHITDAGMAELRARMPYAEVSRVEDNRRLSAVADLFTVDLLVRYVDWKLGKKTAGALRSVSDPSGFSTLSCGWCRWGHRSPCL